MLIDSVYSHNLPVMLQSWASPPASRSLSDSPSGYHSNHEWSPKTPANGGEKEIIYMKKTDKMEKWNRPLRNTGAKHLINTSITNKLWILCRSAPKWVSYRWSHHPISCFCDLLYSDTQHWVANVYISTWAGYQDNKHLQLACCCLEPLITRCIVTEAIHRILYQ